MINQKGKHIVVLGGGPAGLCVAWNLAVDGHHVTVLEKESVCGGQSLTFERDGFRYDLGPHNIHSRHRTVIDFLFHILPEQFSEHQILPQIYFRGNRVNYPLVGVEVLRSLPVLTAALCSMGFVWRRAVSVFLPGIRDDGTYETWVVNRFGRRFYNIFFGPYSQKVWGIPPCEMSDVVARKRIAVKSLGELIRAMILRKENYHAENPRLVKQFYTRRGVGEICNFFERGIEERGGKILKEAAAKSLILQGTKILGVEYTQAGREELIEISTAGNSKMWQVISTIPLNEMVLQLKGDVPPAMRSAAAALDFTSEVFLYLNVNRPDIWGVPLLYFSEVEFPFNRAYDVGLFSREMVPPGKNAVCLELTCNYMDKIWQCEEEELLETCIKPLERHGLLNRSQIEGYHVRRIRHAYPRFRVGYEEKLRVIFRFLSGIDNLITLGRQGLFTYANVDDVIWMAFEVAKHIGYQDRISLTAEQLLTDYVDI